jgi:cytochrome c oxidase subunit 4
MAAHDPKRNLITYIVVFVSLLVLTLATVLVAEINLGALNDVVALGIAVTKATLVILFFMHVKDSTRLTALTAMGGFLWLAILIGLTMADYLSRGAIIPVPGK